MLSQCDAIVLLQARWRPQTEKGGQATSSPTDDCDSQHYSIS